MDQTAPAMPPPPPPPMVPSSPQTTHSSTMGILIIGAMVVGISCLIAGYFWGLADGKKSPVATTTPTQTIEKKDETVMTPTSTPVAGACKYYGGLSPNTYFPTYSVRTAMTVGEIAQQQLGNASRSQELIQLNKKLYPNLIDSTSIVEQGSEFLLIPKDIKRTSGDIEIYAGKINRNGETFGISFGESSSAGGIYIPNAHVAHLTNVKDLQVGDCIVAVSDRGMGLIVKVAKQ